jgi:hypothetical protein
MIDVQIVMLSGQKYDYKTDDQNIESEYFKRYSKGELFAVVMKNITHHTNGTKSVIMKKIYIDTKRIDYAAFTISETK